MIAGTDLATLKGRAWRRTERRIVAEHNENLAVELRGLCGEVVTAAIRTSPSTVTVSGAAWQVVLSGVADTSVDCLIQLTDRLCRIEAAGRYGRFWWLAVDTGSGENRQRAVVLGSQLRLTGLGGGTRAMAPFDPELCSVPRVLPARSPVS